RCLDRQYRFTARCEVQGEVPRVREAVQRPPRYVAACCHPVLALIEEESCFLAAHQIQQKKYTPLENLNLRRDVSPEDPAFLLESFEPPGLHVVSFQYPQR